MIRTPLIYALLVAMAACGGETSSLEPDASLDASDLDAQTPPTDGGDDGGGGDAGDAGDGGNDAGDGGGGDASAPCLTFDPPDEFGEDEDCDGAEGTRDVSVYVSNTGDDTFAGSPNYPVKTLARAVELMDRAPSRKYIYVASSADPYDAAGLGDLLERGASIHGSLSIASGWSRPEGAETTLSTVFSTDGDGVHAHVTHPRVELSFARIVSARGAGQVHSVGLTLTGQGTVDLSYVDIVTDDGLDGTHGAGGEDAPVANNGAVNWADESPGPLSPEPRKGGAGGAVKACVGLTTAERNITRGGRGGDGKKENCCPPEDGVAGGGGASGGDRGENGSRGGKNGTRGSDGGRGSDADPRMSDAWSITDGRIEWNAFADATHGVPGGGGGGGGGAQTNGNGCLNNRAPGGTGGGAGGCPGTAGESGGSGGFSVGVVALGAPPELRSVRIVTGRGGRGGDAGQGGEGAAGGTSPSSISVWCNNYTGGRGGAGGSGGDGGHGAPGSGGWSVGVLSANPLSEESLITFELGAPGEAGAAVAGGPVSGDGASHEVFVW